MRRLPPFDGYGREDRPFLAYVTLVGIFATGVLSFASGRGGGRMRPEMPLSDLLLLGTGAHKIARIATTAWITAPLRAPFVTHVGVARSGDLKERGRGRGLRRAIGDLVTCPYCMGPWISAGLLGLYVVRPATARFVSGAFTLATISDFLNKAYVRIDPMRGPPPRPRAGEARP